MSQTDDNQNLDGMFLPSTLRKIERLKELQGDGDINKRRLESLRNATVARVNDTELDELGVMFPKKKIVASFKDDFSPRRLFESINLDVLGFCDGGGDGDDDDPCKERDEKDCDGGCNWSRYVVAAAFASTSEDTRGVKFHGDFLHLIESFSTLLELPSRTEQVRLIAEHPRIPKQFYKIDVKVDRRVKDAAPSTTLTISSTVDASPALRVWPMIEGATTTDEKSVVIGTMSLKDRKFNDIQIAECVLTSPEVVKILKIRFATRDNNADYDVKILERFADADSREFAVRFDDDNKELKISVSDVDSKDTPLYERAIATLLRGYARSVKGLADRAHELLRRTMPTTYAGRQENWWCRRLPFDKSTVVTPQNIRRVVGYISDVMAVTLDLVCESGPVLPYFDDVYLPRKYDTVATVYLHNFLAHGHGSPFRAMFAFDEASKKSITLTKKKGSVTLAASKKTDFEKSYKLPTELRASINVLEKVTLRFVPPNSETDDVTVGGIVAFIEKFKAKFFSGRVTTLAPSKYVRVNLGDLGSSSSDDVEPTLKVARQYIDKRGKATYVISTDAKGVATIPFCPVREDVVLRPPAIEDETTKRIKAVDGQNVERLELFSRPKKDAFGDYVRKRQISEFTTMALVFQWSKRLNEPDDQAENQIVVGSESPDSFLNQVVRLGSDNEVREWYQENRNKSLNEIKEIVVLNSEREKYKRNLREIDKDETYTEGFRHVGKVQTSPLGVRPLWNLQKNVVHVVGAGDAYVAEVRRRARQITTPLFDRPWPSDEDYLVLLKNLNNTVFRASPRSKKASLAMVGKMNSSLPTATFNHRKKLFKFDSSNVPNDVSKIMLVVKSPGKKKHYQFLTKVATVNMS